MNETLLVSVPQIFDFVSSRFTREMEKYTNSEQQLCVYRKADRFPSEVGSKNNCLTNNNPQLPFTPLRNKPFISANLKLICVKLLWGTIQKGFIHTALQCTAFYLTFSSEDSLCICQTRSLQRGHRCKPLLYSFQTLHTASATVFGLEVKEHLCSSSWSSGNRKKSRSSFTARASRWKSDTLEYTLKLAGTWSETLKFVLLYSYQRLELLQQSVVYYC